MQIPPKRPRNGGSGLSAGTGALRLLGRLGLLCLAVAMAVGLGFVAFVLGLAREEPALTGNADGIVVLTGGSERIADALQMLASGRARRLLITGVNTGTSQERLARQAPGYAGLFDCCVDIDHHAVNTEGNAEEAAGWMRRTGFRSLLVVTSSYHMPRALVELRRHLPNVPLTPVPVVTPRLRSGGLWRDPNLLRVLFVEYGKFVVAYGRARLTRGQRSEDIVTAAAERLT